MFHLLRHTEQQLYWSDVMYYVDWCFTCCVTQNNNSIGLMWCITYLPTIPDSPELLRKSASNYGITARGKIITEIVDYGNLVTSGNNW